MSHELGHVLQLEGPVVIGTVNGLVDRGVMHIKQGDLVVDFSQTTDIDSSALAMILQWQREADQAQTKLNFIHVPANLLTLADLYGVSFLFKNV